MAYRLLPGIRQDHRGRFYQQAVYPNGKTILVPYAEVGAERARTIPVTEPQPRQRRILTVKPLDMSKRRMRVDFRVRGERDVRTVQDQNEVVQAFVDQHRADAYTYIHPETKREEYFRARSDMYEGGELILRRESNWDWFVQYHVDVKETTNV